MDLMPATFGGAAFKKRELTHEAEVRDGTVWRTCGSDSEYMPLRHITLYRPSEPFDARADFDENLFLANVSSADLASAYHAIAETYRSIGITVNVVDSSLINDSVLPNAVFQRDVSWATPSGVVVGRMASTVRAGEERAITAALANIRVPIALTIRGNGTLEGADCLWLRPDRVMCGVGKRTNASGYGQLKNWLDQGGIQLVGVPVPSTCQHLLGGVQIVSSTKALVRSQIVSPIVVDTLRSADYDVVEVPEHDDVAVRMAFNFVTVKPNSVVMPKSAWLASFLERNNVEVVGQVDMSSHIKAGGGLGCTTGILSRELV